MTEDDTFRILRRTPRVALRRLLHSEFTPSNYHLAYDDWIKEKQEFLAKHGWTIYEFNRAWIVE